MSNSLTFQNKLNKLCHSVSSEISIQDIPDFPICSAGMKHPLLNHVQFSATGFNKDSAILRLLKKMAVSLHFRSFDRHYYLGCAELPFFIHPRERFIQQEDSDLLFDDYLNQFYQLTEHSFDAFTDFMTGNDRGVLSLPFRRSDGSEILLPSSWIQAVFRNSGEGIGCDQETARQDALKKILAQSVLINLLTCPHPLPRLTLPSALIEKADKLQIMKHQNTGKDRLFLFDATFNGRFPSVLAVMSNQSKGRIRVACSCGNNLQEAVESAVLSVFEKQNYHRITEEYSRLGSEENILAVCEDGEGYLPADLFASPLPENISETINFPEIKSGNDYQLIIQNCLKENDITDFNCYEWISEDNGIFFSKILIPGYSEISDPSLFETQTPGVFSIYRDYVADIAREDDPCAVQDFLDSLAENELNIKTPVMKILGMVIDDPLWRSLTLQDLQFMMFLKIGNLDEAWDVLNNILSGSDKPEYKLVLFQCCRDLMWINQDEDPQDQQRFSSLLDLLYTPEILNMSRDILKGSGPILEKLKSDPWGCTDDHQKYLLNFAKLHCLF